MTKMTGSGTRENLKYQLYAFGLFAVVALLTWVAITMFNQGFTPFVQVTLHADRAGLQMRPDNRVKIRGVDLGKVDKVEAAPDGQTAVITLSLFPDMVGHVPANVQASLEQLTAFGNKTVQLNYPSDPSTQTLHAGSVIQADHVSVEANTVFEHLVNTLNNIQPAKLNATLGAFADALRRRGDQIGQTAVLANAYLAKFNGNMPALQRDFRSTAQFANLYGDVTPNLIRLLSNGDSLSKTLVDTEGELKGATSAGIDLGHEGEYLFGANADPLAEDLQLLRPTTSLLAEYSPEFTCLIQGGDVSLAMLRKTFPDPHGLRVSATLSYGDEPYKYPQDLPENGPGPLKGPNCHGLPVIQPGEGHLLDNTTGPTADRSKTNTPQLPSQPLVVELFGPGAMLHPPVNPMMKPKSSGGAH
jgi:phospholipid/cholesterol/gamma-HCH transport system substrate-binding protein